MTRSSIHQASRPLSAAALSMLLAACGPSPGRTAETDPGNAGKARALAAERPLRAAFLVVDGVYNSELMAPWDVFQHTRYHAPEGTGIEVVAVSPDGQPITTAEGLRILPDFGFDDCPEVDILVVPSSEGSRDRDRTDRRLVAWVRERGREALFSMSLCWGAFVLAEADLLDGRACTTFPGDYRLFAQSFPELDLRINISFVHDGRVLTSQGGARSYDVAMYLVDLLYGAEVARGIGRGLLIPWPPIAEDRPAFISDPGARPGRG